MHIVWNTSKQINKQTLVANRSEFTVSLKCSSCGDTLTNMSVLELPPSEFCSRYVSLLSLYGMWDFYNMKLGVQCLVVTWIRWKLFTSYYVVRNDNSNSDKPNRRGWSWILILLERDQHRITCGLNSSVQIVSSESRDTTIWKATYIPHNVDQSETSYFTHYSVIYNTRTLDLILLHLCKWNWD